MDEEQVAAAAVWVDQYAAASEQLKDQLAALLRAAWFDFDDWYSPTAVGDLGRQMADLSVAAQQQATGAAIEYVTQVLAVLDQAPTARTPRVRTPEVRNGADLRLVHTRPAETFRKAIATGTDVEAAVLQAVDRAANLGRTDLSLVERQVERAQLEAAGVKGYRRVIRPELSESGSCGLCIVASDRIYKTSDLLPIHPPHCKCKTMPIVGTNDPGLRINADDLRRLYDAAGREPGESSTRGEDLKRIRVTVNQHGELGPVLTRKGHEFRSQRQVPLEKDPDRARRMLEKVAPVLADLERRARAGEDVSGPLGYQRDLADKLRRIAGPEAAAA